MTTTEFRSTQDGLFESVTLVEVESKGLLRRATERVVPFAEWVTKVPEGAESALGQILSAIDDNEHETNGETLAQSEAERVLLHPKFVAALTEPEALALGLPPVARLSLNLQSVGVAHQPDFKVELRWTKPNGLPARASLSGSRITFEGKPWRVADPIWTAVQLTEQVNAAKQIDERQAALAALRQTIGDEDRQLIRPDGFIERMQLSYAAGFSLELKPSVAGFDFNPILFSPERLKETEDGAVLDENADSLLPPNRQEEFARRFRASDGKRKAFLLDGGQILFLDPSLQKALEVVRVAQGGNANERRAFASNPQRKVIEALSAAGIDSSNASALFIETQQFSERVSGIDIWRKPVLPWIKPKPNSWLPEAFGIRIGDPPDETIVEISPSEVDQALVAIESAIEAGERTARIGENEVPATEQARSALADLAELSRQAQASSSGDAAPTIATQRYFLQVQDNLEDVAYAPLAAAPQSKDEPAPSFPKSVKSSPKPHQTIGFHWLVDCWRSGMPGALLADDMGLGKTFQALSFLAWLRETKSDRHPILIVAPTGLLANWKAEIGQHLNANALGPIVSAFGAGLHRFRERSGRDIDLGESTIDSDVWSDAGIVLTTFETLRDYHLSFARQRFAVIIYDEIQKLKNPASQMTRAAKTLNARFQLAMTGTPVENRLQDLWSIYDVIHPGLLGSSKMFETSYPPSDTVKLRELNGTLTEPHDGRPALLLRRMKDDCLEGLPGKHIHALPTDMPAEQATAYERVIQRAMALKSAGKRGHMLEILHQLRGVSLHPTAPGEAQGNYFSQSARLAAMFETLDAIAAKQEKALIFCESLAMQALLGVELRRRYNIRHEILRIHGGVTGDARQAAVEQFQNRGPGFDVMILSPKAGGVGLTLTAANHVIHLSRWWNPAVEDQATDRVFRIGQKRDVHVYLPQSVHPDPAVRESSFDLKLDALMRRKRELSRGLLIPGEDATDASALFDEVVNDQAAPANTPSAGTAPSDGVAIATAAATPNSEPPTKRPSANVRPMIRLQQPQAKPASPRRVPRFVFEPRQVANYDIFSVPLHGLHIEQITLKDPYVCSRSRNRQALIDFMKIMVPAARRVDAVWVHALDADSVDSYSESDVFQRDDIERRWRDAFPQSPAFRLTQLSKRVHRTFHARELVAKTVDGWEIIWDLDNGVDGVMLPERRCVVNCFIPDEYDLVG